MTLEGASVRVQTVKVPGARLHVEVRGQGPLLFLLGGMAGGGGLAVLTPQLAQHFTVVTHDRRGLGASEPDDQAATVEVETDADDVSAMLAQLSSVPLLVAGNSNGAVLGLDPHRRSDVPRSPAVAQLGTSPTGRATRQELARTFLPVTSSLPRTSPPKPHRCTSISSRSTRT